MSEVEFLSDEEQRLMCLKKLRILDTPVEERFDRITRIVCQSLNVPVSAISLVDRDRQWFKSVQGLDLFETPRNVAFCSQAILNDDPLIVPDALKDPRFCDNPLVTGEPGIRFYAGCPLKIGDTYRIGTLCAIDHLPRELGEADTVLLRDLAAMVVSEISNMALSQAHEGLLSELKEVERSALIDPLTRLWNRAGGEKLLDREWNAALRHKSPVSFIKVDIDRFKQVNDQYGHDIGDQVLKHIAFIIQSSLRPYDVAVRWGGEEFLIVLPGCDERPLRQALERIMSAIWALPAATDKGDVAITASMGAVAAYPKAGDDVMKLLKKADLAMYMAKSAGRNQYMIDEGEDNALLSD